MYRHRLPSALPTQRFISLTGCQPFVLAGLHFVVDLGDEIIDLILTHVEGLLHANFVPGNCRELFSFQSVDVGMADFVVGVVQTFCPACEVWFIVCF